MEVEKASNRGKYVQHRPNTYSSVHTQQYIKEQLEDSVFFFLILFSLIASAYATLSLSVSLYHPLSLSFAIAFTATAHVCTVHVRACKAGTELIYTYV